MNYADFKFCFDVLEKAKSINLDIKRDAYFHELLSLTSAGDNYPIYARDTTFKTGSVALIPPNNTLLD